MSILDNPQKRMSALVDDRFDDPELPPVIETENPEHRRMKTCFLPAKLEDNKIFTKKDPYYRDRLYEAGKQLADAMLSGDWSSFAGQFLSEFRYESHVVKPFEVPDGWTRFRGYDWGYAAPACMLWFAQEPETGRLFIYKEYYAMKKTDPIQAEDINQMSYGETFIYNWADPSVWKAQTSQTEAKSTGDVFLEKGIYLLRADNDQQRKTKRIRSALANIYDKKPGLQIFSSCVNTIMELENLVSDPDKQEVPLAGQPDHAYDACCYGLNSYIPPMIKRPQQQQGRSKGPLHGVKGI